MNATGTKKGEDAKHKRCKPTAQGGCGKLKSRLKEFKPRWSKCEKHREQGLSKDDPKVLKCDECKSLRTGFVRQPLCIECDSKRGKQEGKKATTKVTAKSKKSKSTVAAPVVAAPAPAPVAQPQPVNVAPPPAPVVQHAAPPASPPVPAPSPASAVSAVAALLEGQKEESADSAGPAQQAAPLFETPVGVSGGGAAVSAVLEAPAAKPAMKGKMPSFRGPPPQGPSLIFRGAADCEHGVPIRDCKQGCTGRKYAQAGLCDIKRLFRALTTRESRVARAEERLKVANEQFKGLLVEARNAGGLEVSPSDVKERYAAAHERREYEISRVNNAKAWREFTAKRLRMFLDHALSNTPYTKARECPDGKCEKCNHTGMLREETKSPYAKAATPILRHLSRALEVAELCYKVRARTSEKDAAYKTLLDRHMGVVKKFGNPHQTAMEGDDAEQGAMIGLLDGAVRYDPTEPIQYLCPICGYREKVKKQTVEIDGKIRKRRKADENKMCPSAKCKKRVASSDEPNPMMVLTSTAIFQTVAWSWSKRNSRARKTTDERPGLRPSIDDPTLGGKKAEDGGLADQVAVVDGKAQIVGEKTKIEDKGLAAMDLHTQIGLLEDETQKKVVEYLLDNHTPAEIAAKLDMTSRQVVKVREAAFAVLRERLGGVFGRARSSQVEEVAEV